MTKENWLQQEPRKQGLEIDSAGYPVMNVYFYGEASENVIIDPIPHELDSPRWNGKEWVEGERSAGVYRTGKNLSKDNRET